MVVYLGLAIMQRNVEGYSKFLFHISDCTEVGVEFKGNAKETSYV